MPTRLKTAAILIVALALAGCCRENLREMASVKDVGVRSKERTVKAEPKRLPRAAKVEQDDDDEVDERIETGSIEKPTCQGQHLAYQATKEYLKNFGPKPPDQPGDPGPCKPAP